MLMADIYGGKNLQGSRYTKLVYGSHEQFFATRKVQNNLTSKFITM